MRGAGRSLEFHVAAAIRRLPPALRNGTACAALSVTGAVPRRGRPRGPRRRLVTWGKASSRREPNPVLSDTAAVHGTKSREPGRAAQGRFCRLWEEIVTKDFEGSIRA